MKKILFFFTFLIVAPLGLNAELQDSYKIEWTGWSSTLLSDYDWSRWEGESGYLTKSEQSGKSNLQCSNEVAQKLYRTYLVTCAFDKDLLIKSNPQKYGNIVKCTSPAGEQIAFGSTEAIARSRCVNYLRKDDETGVKRTITCYDENNLKYSLEADINNSSFKTEKKESWLTSNPDTTRYIEVVGEAKYYCTWNSKSSGVSTKNLKQPTHKTTNGDTAYCINPGGVFSASQTYVKKAEYDINSCQKSNDSFNCGLAATILKANELNYDYASTLIALRLWAADNGHGDDWWDQETEKKYSGANVYSLTVDRIKNGYNGTTSSISNGVIYATGENLTKFQKAIDLYKTVRNGFDLWYPNFKVIEGPNHVDGSNYNYYVETNFAEGAQIKNITLSQGGVNGYRYEKCKNDSSKNCILITAYIPDKNKETIANIVYDYPGGLISKLGLYQTNINPANYQEMYIVDNTSEYVVPLNLQGTCSCVKQSDGSTKCYGLEGEEVSESAFKSQCSCRQIDNDFYGVNFTKVNSYEEMINSCKCTSPLENGSLSNYYDVNGLITDLTGWANSCSCTTPEENGRGKYFATDMLMVSNESEMKEYCDKLTCPNKKITKNISDSCETGSLGGKIADPTMCTILSDNSLKSSYERQSSTFASSGVEGSSKYEKSYCTIYCRENITLTFMDKVYALAGRTFKYNVDSKYSKDKDLTTVILSEKQCTSIIRYDEWLEDYKKTNDAVLNAWNELKKYEAAYNHGINHNSILEVSDQDHLHITHPSAPCSDNPSCCECCTGCIDSKSLVAMIGSGENKDNNKTDSISTLIAVEDDNDAEDEEPCTPDGGASINCDKSYWLFKWDKSYYNYTNTNGTEEEKSYAPEDSGSKGTCSANACGNTCTNTASDGSDSGLKDDYKTAKDTYEKRLIERDEIIAKLQDCNFMQNSGSNNPRPYTNNIYYETSESGNYTVPSSISKLSNYDNLLNNYETRATVEIDYEENTTYNERYMIGNNSGSEPKTLSKDPYNHFDSVSYSMSSKTEDVCSKCEGDLSVGSSSNIGPSSFNTDSEDKIPYWVCTGSELDAECHNMGEGEGENYLAIPKNRLVNIVVDHESRFYQGSKLYNQLYTGEIRLEKDLPSKSYIYGWRKTDDYSYPVSAYRNTGDYNISIEYKNLWETNRIINAEYNAGTYQCVYEVENALTKYDCTPTYGHICANYSDETSFGAYYRNIDLTDIFPNSQFSKYKNQVSTINRRDIGFNWINATKVIEEIQENGNNIINNSNIKPMYVINLTSSDIANIKRYNKTTDYLYNSVSCDANTFRCTSGFLTEMANNTFGSLTFGNNASITGEIETNEKSPNSLYYYGGK